MSDSESLEQIARTYQAQMVEHLGDLSQGDEIMEGLLNKVVERLAKSQGDGTVLPPEGRFEVAGVTIEAGAPHPLGAPGRVPWRMNDLEARVAVLETRLERLAEAVSALTRAKSS